MDHSRTELLIGEDGVRKLSRAHVAIFGLGGVGGYALEAVARAGIGHLYLFDFDVVQPSNLNRQILAAESSIGMTKTDAALRRIKDINPGAEVIVQSTRITGENVGGIIPHHIGYAIDAIDELDAKVALISALRGMGIAFVSSMGAGNKLNPGGIKVADISRTSHCPLARKVRKMLKSRGITDGVPCIYSEEVRKGERKEPESDMRTVGSISYLPGIFGLTAAGVIINRMLSEP